MKDLLLPTFTHSETPALTASNLYGPIAFLAYPGGNNQRDIIFGVRGEVRNGSDWGGTVASGSAYRSTGATQILRYPANTSSGDNRAGRFFTGSTAHTFFVGIFPTAWGTGTGQNSVLGIASGSTLRMAFGRANPTDGHCRYYGSDGTTGYNSATVNNVILLGQNQVVVCRRDGANIDFWRNGTLIGSTTVVNTPIGLGATSSVNNGWTIMQRGYTSTVDTRGFIGNIWFLCALPFAASSYLIQAICANPFMLVDSYNTSLSMAIPPVLNNSTFKHASTRMLFC